MARLNLPSITGTKGNVTVYWMRGKLYMRAKSSLFPERVKTDPAFAPTRWYADIMATAAPISSRVYQALSRKYKKVYPYQFLTGKAIDLLKQGLDKSLVLQMLQDLYGNMRSFMHTGLVQNLSIQTVRVTEADSRLTNMDSNRDKMGNIDIRGSS